LQATPQPWVIRGPCFFFLRFFLFIVKLSWLYLDFIIQYLVLLSSLPFLRCTHLVHTLGHLRSHFFVVSALHHETLNVERLSSCTFSRMQTGKHHFYSPFWPSFLFIMLWHHSAFIDFTLIFLKFDLFILLHALILSLL